MIRVDRRAGSAELEAPLRAAGLEVELATLPSGDIEFMGLGPGGRPVTIGVEYKKIPDLLQCSRDGRYAEQLREMRKRYEVCWLLVEGEWRVAPALYTGGGPALEVREKRGWESRGKHTYQEVAAWLATMVQCGGALLWRTTEQAESVAWLRTLYWWWTAKAFDDHRAHLEWYTPPYAPASPFELKPSKAQQVAAALLANGAGVDVNGDRARAAAAHFGSVRAMLEADEKAWREVEGIGPKIAKQVVEVMR